MKKILSDDTPRAVAVASPVPFAGYLTYSRSQHSGYLRACPFRGAISFWRGYGKSLRVSQRAYCCGGGSVFLCHPVTQRSAVGGTNNPTGVANIVGVKGDLLGIANAERQYYASQSKYASLDELTEGHYLTISGGQPPYTYDVETSGSGFQVTATRSDGELRPSFRLMKLCRYRRRINSNNPVVYERAEKPFTKTQLFYLPFQFC